MLGRASMTLYFVLRQWVNFFVGKLVEECVGLCVFFCLFF